MARLSRSSRDAKAQVFTSPADKPKLENSNRRGRASEVVSPLGYTVCEKCGHVVGLAKAAFSDLEADPPIRFKQPILRRHDSEGWTRKGGAQSRTCLGASSVPTNPIFQNPKE